MAPPSLNWQNGVSSKEARVSGWEASQFGLVMK